MGRPGQGHFDGKSAGSKITASALLGFFDSGVEIARRAADLVIKTMAFAACRSQSDSRVGSLKIRDAEAVKSYIDNKPACTGGDLLDNFGFLAESRRNLRSFLKEQAKKLTKQDLKNYNICVVGDPVILAVSLSHPGSCLIPKMPEIWQWMIGVGSATRVINVVRRG